MADKARRSRRRWSEDFKRRVVAEAAAPGVSAAAVARRYDLNANLLFNWKRRYGISDHFLPVEICEPALPAPQVGQEAPDREVRGVSTIEVSLANGHRVAVKGLDGAALCRLMRSLAAL